MAAIITTFQAPKTMEDLLDRYEYDQRTNIDIIMDAINDDDYTEWTVSKNLIPGDKVFFYCAATACQHLTALKKSVPAEVSAYLNEKIALYRKYSGQIIAVGTVLEEPFQSDSGYVSPGWQSRWYAKIGKLRLLDKPLSYSVFKECVPVNRYSAITTMKEDQEKRLSLMIEQLNPEPPTSSESPYEDHTFVEGNRIVVYGTKYERNPKVRETFLKAQQKPFRCAACGFVFEQVYGSLGKDYIEVHHRMPLYVNAVEQPVNPLTDLVCLCSNCHRMIHRNRDRILTAEELKQLIESPV